MQNLYLAKDVIIIYTNTAYLNNSMVDFKDKSRSLIVSSCGVYHIFSRKKLPTYRPKGRIDYQLLYIASGKGHFYFEKDKEVIVSAGHMVLYRPREMQKYVYYEEDQTEVYWVHFTGSDVKNILKNHFFPTKDHVIYSGTIPEYQHIFRKMIQELQLCKADFENYLSLLLYQLFIIVGRQQNELKPITSTAQNDIEYATYYFNKNYNKKINIDEFAASINMSTCWFIRNFKQYNKITPMAYIVSIRIVNAQNLLETTSYNVNEIASIVGYDNPLYFSRLFKKQTGLSPTDYRKQYSMNAD